MKLLALASTLDLEYRLGCTPSWWQLLKAFHESGHEVLAAPYLGDPIETLWWRPVANPCARESKIFNRIATTHRSAQLSGKAGLSKRASRVLIERHIRPKWKNHLFDVLSREKDIDMVLAMNVPLNHFTGIPSALKEEFGVKFAYYDGDMPTILPKYVMGRGFKFNYYEGADLSEYDAFFSNSKGVIPDLEEMGARNVRPLYYAADPELFQPVDVPQDLDVSFLGWDNRLREHWMTELITKPSEAMSGARFAIGGGSNVGPRRFTIPLGRAEFVGDVPYSAYGRFVGRSKINLNTTRTSHTSVYASATARPFELAAFGACIVSQPYSGIEEWFDVGKELIVVDSGDEAIEVYNTLLKDEETRREFGRRARKAILDRHTFRHRVAEILGAVQ